jgi:hypothetical protein
MAQDIGNALQVSLGSSLPTYKAVLFDVVPYTAASDILNISLASTATVALKVTRCYVSYDATASSTSDAYLIRRITANTGGTPTTLTTTQAAFLSGFGVVTQSDTSDAATAATVVGYTVAPSPLGTGQIIDGGHITIPAASVPAVSVTFFELTFANRGSKPPVIRPGQSISLSLGANSVPAGASLYASIEWVEIPLASVF